MPVEYKFVRISDGEVMSLNEIDELVCEAMGLSVDPDEFSLHYQMLVLFGTGAAWTDGYTTEQNVEDHAKKCWAHHPGHLHNTFADVCRRFTYQEYRFEAWRSYG